MGILVDVIIVAIVAISTFLAYKKGLINVAVGLFAFIISLVVAFVLYQPIANFVINVTNIDETVQNAIYEKTNDIMQNQTQNNSNELSNQLIEAASNNMLPETSRTIAINIVRGGVMIILLVGTRIGLIFVKTIANFVAKLPIIEQFDKLGGAIFGFLRGILFIFVILLILMIPFNMNSLTKVSQAIDQSYIGKTMYEKNILQVFFMKVQ